MKVLWIVNIIFPYPAKMLGNKPTVFGGWLNSLLKGIKESNEVEEIGIMTVYNGKSIKKFKDDKITYYLIPSNNFCKYDIKLEKYCLEIEKEFKPDLVHIHGTEYPHGLAFLNACPHIKSCTSIQGLVSVYGIKDIYNAGIDSWPMIKNITFRDFIKKDFFVNQYKDFIKRGVYEKQTLEKSNIVIGRTTWDCANSFQITGEKKYEHCNENLRETFYKKTWNINKIERHTIFVSQASYPIKGFHKILEALVILKKIYPDIKIKVAGTKILDNRLKLSGYAKYLKKIISKNNLQKNIAFLGLLNEKEMCDNMLKSNLFLQASSIENSPNSLGEAMLLSMPCVASNVGGTSDMLIDKKEGFLYPFNDVSLMVNYIIEIFENDSLAIELGKNAKKHAEKTHNIDYNVNKMIEIYNKLKK